MFQRRFSGDIGRLSRSFAAAIFSTIIAILLQFLTRVRRPAFLFAPLLLATLVNPAYAQSACATRSLTVASGGQVSDSIAACSAAGTSSIITGPSHGNLNGLPAGGNDHTTITYINNGDGATSDTFTLGDEQGYPVIFNVTISAPTSPLTMTPVSSSNPVIGSAFFQQLSTTGGVAPYTYAIDSGRLPNNITMSSSGAFSGTTNETGSFSFVVRVTDSTAPTQLTATKSYSMTVGVPSQTI